MFATLIEKCVWNPILVSLAYGHRCGKSSVAPIVPICSLFPFAPPNASSALRQYACGLQG